jgi:hypothetical protein
MSVKLWARCINKKVSDANPTSITPDFASSESEEISINQSKKNASYSDENKKISSMICNS